MSDLSRRKLITNGLGAAAGVAGLGVAARIAQGYGLIPPDHGGIYGLGETLTYSCPRVPSEPDFEDSCCERGRAPERRVQAPSGGRIR
jgi:hypothetical protein